MRLSHLFSYLELTFILCLCQSGLARYIMFSAGEKMLRLVKMALNVEEDVGSRAIWNLRYADDTTLLATSPEELKHHVNESQKTILLFGQQRHV